jgi:predicted transcriptional regulator of viral defense system
MRYADLRTFRDRLYFTVEELQDLLRISRESARVLCSRYVKKGLFIRLKKNFYILSESWEGLSTEDLLKISNLLQVPSYLSFSTALTFYEVTTQVQRNYFESASVKRSARFEIEGTVFNYYKIQRKYYFDFIRKGDLFIATKEKAFMDSIYLYSFGKYKLDFSAVDMERLEKKKIMAISEIYPERTKGIIKRICGE